MHDHWTLYTNGRIHTSHPVLPARSDALLVHQGRILILGPAPALRRMARGDLTEVDLARATVFPGFCDAHLHLQAYGQSLSRLQLAQTDGLAELAARLSERATRREPGAWIVGRGWNGRLLLGDPPPAWDAVAQAAADHPVALFSHDGHTVWLSQAAGQALDVDAGILRETAAMALYERIPDDIPRRDAILAAQRALLGRGITAVHNFEGLTDFGVYQQLLRRGELDLQVLLNLAASEQQDALALGLQTGFGDDKLRIGHVKFFLDGALGSRTALLETPYADTGQTGQRLIEPEALREALGRLRPAGLVPAMHAIGDGAVRMALEALQQTQGRTRARFRPRIEHAELFPESLVALASKLDVVCSVQPTHLFEDLLLAEQALGERAADMLPLARLKEAGMRLLIGSDAPIVAPDPMATVYAASERRGPDGSPAGGFYPDQRIRRDEALALQFAGVLGAGATASFVAYAEDPLTVPADRLLSLRPVLVVAGGKIVHDARA